MLTLLTFSLLGSFVGFRASRSLGGSELEPSRFTCDRIFITVICGALGVAVGIVPADIIGRNLPQVTFESAPVRLVGMRMANTINGVFILASGGVSSAKNFSYYYVNSDGSFSPGEIPADSSVKIVEDSELRNEGSMVFQTKRVDPNHPLANWALQPKQDQVVRFTVPAGSVKGTFSFE